MIRGLSSIVFLLFFVSGVAQQRFAVNGFGGFVIAHRTVMQNLVTGHTTGGEFTYEKAFRGTESWHSLYRYPSFGLSLSSLDLGNPSKLGSAYALLPYMRLPLIKKNDRLAFKFGIGLGYLTKHFSQQENHKNVAIGSAFNGTVVIGLWYKVPVGKALALQTGFQIQHFSNGSFRTPNLGINLPMLALGLQFGKQSRLPASEIETIQEAPELDKKAQFFLSARIGVKELMETGTSKYPAYTFHFSRLKPISFKYSYQLFADVLYNSSLDESLGGKGIVLNHDIEYTQVGLGAGLENHYGKFALYLQMAAYLYCKDADLGRFYHRLGVKHDISERCYASFGLKSHFAKADYFEIGWGIKL